MAIMQFVKETLGKIVDQTCIRYADKEAMVFADDGSRLTYADFHALYLSLAKALYRLGIRKGQHIAVMAANSPAWLALQVASAKIGAVLVCINTAYTARELAYALDKSDAVAVFFAGGRGSKSYLDVFMEISPQIKRDADGAVQCKRLPRLRTVIAKGESLPDGVIPMQTFISSGKTVPDSVIEQAEALISNEDTVSIQFTSGTTDNPKAVMLSHYAVVNSALICGESLHYTPEDRLMLCLPMFHVIGCILSGILSILHGSTLVILGRFQTDRTLEYLEKEHCTALNAVPTMFHYLLDSPQLSPAQFPSLKKGFIAGNCCFPSLLQDIMHVLHIEELSIVYGQTECLIVAQTLPEDDTAKRLHTIGRVSKGVQAKVMALDGSGEAPQGERGELCVKAPYTMKGYYKNPEATGKAISVDGWLHTGDLAAMDDDGYITIAGRIKELIIRGGENISPVEIENALKEFEDVKDAAVVGVPDPVMGEELCAVVIPRTHDLCKQALFEHLRERLSAYKVPKYVRIVSAFPLTASGKVKKYQLQEQVTAALHLNAPKQVV